MSSASDGAIIRHRGLIPAIALALAVAIAPWPFGGVEPRTVLVLGILVCIAGLGAALTVRSRPPGTVVAAAVALAVLALQAWLQSLTWPAAVVEVISSRHLDAVRSAAEALEGFQVVATPVEVDSASLSFAPASARATATWIAVLGCALLTSVFAGRGRLARRLVAGVFVVVAMIEVLFGARRWFARATTLWGVDIPGDPARLRGTFVNPDHLATYLLMALAVTFAWGWWSYRRLRYTRSIERRLAMVAVPALVWLCLFAGMAFTKSRAGLAAAIVTVAVQGALAAIAQGRWRIAPSGFVAGGLGLGVVALIGLQQGLGRWVTTGAHDLLWNARPQIYRACMDLVIGFPILGVGIGSFAEAFPAVQPANLTGFWRHAHSDWIELLVTAGVVGVILVVVAVVLVLRRLGRVLVAGRRSEDRAAALAGLGVLVGVGLHEAVDFGLTMPASSLTLMVIVGMACGASLQSSRSG